MKKELTLVVMAAGMGSRFGGLKQLEPFGPNGEFITDYSVYDAKLAGFTNVVFIIKRENLELFESTIGKRMEKHIPVRYAFQDEKLVYEDLIFQREKPWGTAHAILSCKDLVNSNFVVINSDDFYGRDAFFVAANFFQENHRENEMGLVGYPVSHTLTENGSVKRGILQIENGYLRSIIESKVELSREKILATPLNKKETFEVQKDTLVSMNMLLFTPKIFDFILEYLPDFVEHMQEERESAEYLIPDVIDLVGRENKATFEVIPTQAKWEGVTYKEDTPRVVNAISKLILEGVYKENLWQD